jgi:hypothetical protein
VTATVVLLTLLLAPAASGSGAPAACKTFTRSDATAPALVRDWFAHSPDERVVMCPQPGRQGSELATALYFGEGGLTRHGTVCTYPRHGLTVAGSGNAALLTRYDRSEALAMALADGECPEPHAASQAQGYVETYDISTSTFAGIMRLWSTIAAAPAAPASGSAVTSGSAVQTRARLQAALGAHTGAPTVTRIVRIPGSVLRHRYALFVKTPDAPAGVSSQYVIYVDKRLRGPYEITAFAETN